MTPFVYDPAVCDGTNDSLTNAVFDGGAPQIGVRYRVPPRCGFAVRLNTGQVLSIENTHGTQVCDFWAHLAADINQFLSMSHCRTWLQSVISKVGDTLVTNWRQPLLEIGKNTSSGVHDTVMSCCDWRRYQFRGSFDYHDNCGDNLRMALAAIGLPVPLVTDPLKLWMNIPITSAGPTSFEPTVSSAGDRFDIRALADCITVISACPADKNLINGPDAMPSELNFSVGA